MNLPLEKPSEHQGIEQRGAAELALGRQTSSRTNGLAEVAGEEDVLHKRLIVSADLALESESDTHVTVIDKELATRLKMSRAMYRFLLLFVVPRTLGEVLSAESTARVLPELRLLLDKRILVDADAPPQAIAARLRATVPYRFCNAPAYAKADATPDFTVLGVPYDLAGTSDCRLAPTAIRQKSLDYLYQVRFDDGRPQGWFDVNRGRWVLGGATIADAGDVYVHYGEDQAELFARISAAIDEVCASRTVPVVLGGDPSVTYATAASLCSRGPLTVVQFAATPAIATVADEGAVFADGFAARVLRIDGVQRMVSLGACCTGPVAGSCPDGVLLRSAADLRSREPGDVLSEWGRDLRVHLSIDLSVATPACMKPDESGIAPGLTLHEIRTWIQSLGAMHRVVGIDIVGLDMQSESAGLSAIIGCQLALVAMSASHDRARDRQ